MRRYTSITTAAEFRPMHLVSCAIFTTQHCSDEAGITLRKFLIPAHQNSELGIVLICMLDSLLPLGQEALSYL